MLGRRPRPACSALEFVCFRFRRTGHAGEFFIHAEVVLDGDRSECLCFAFDLHVFLCFERLVESFGESSSRLRPAREFVNDDDLVVLDHVVHVNLKEAVCPEELGDIVDDLGFLVEQLLCLTPLFQLFIFIDGLIGIDLGENRR